MGVRFPVGGIDAYCVDLLELRQTAAVVDFDGKQLPKLPRETDSPYGIKDMWFRCFESHSLTCVT